MSPPTKRTKKTEAMFLRRLAETGDLQLAAGLCGLHRSCVYSWREGDAAFRAACRQAKAEGLKVRHAQTVRRASVVQRARLERVRAIAALEARDEAPCRELGYAPRAAFAAWHARTQRWSVTAAHRRSGKTVSRVAGLIQGALACRLPRPRFAYIAPFAKQAKAVAWDYFKHYTAQLVPHASAYESELRIELPGGGQVRLFGADNPDSLRGLYLDGVVFDEFATMDPAIWPVVRPTLSDRGGWADFIGTPQGHNEFHRILTAAQNDPDWYVAVLKASQTGLLSEAELASAAKDLTADQYAQEYECSFEAAIQGAYYGAAMAAADAEKRIGAVPWDANLEVHTAWDLGIGDATAIWMWQRAGKEIRVVDYYEAAGAGLDHYVRTLREKPYVYGQHFFPHDVQVRELGSGLSRAETLRSLGVFVTAVAKMGLEDGINAVRRTLPRCRFDAGRCARGLEALRQYRTAWDERAQIFQRAPRHDWTSHAADAFRYLALAADRRDEPLYETPKPDLRWIV